MEDTTKVKKFPIYIELLIYINMAFLVAVGYMFDIFSWLIMRDKKFTKDPKNPDFIPLFNDFNNFYYRHFFKRVQISWGVPIRGPASVEIETLERVSVPGHNLEFTGNTNKLINIASYNYLGYGGIEQKCQSQVINTIRTAGIAATSPLIEFGQSAELTALEERLAEFLGVEASVCFGMGYATNSCNIPAFIGPECAVFSDQYNHASIIIGVRSSGAKVMVFPHNDMVALDNMIRTTIIEGQPRTYRSWKKIIIFCEGIYSMEGTIVNLPELIKIKKKYKAYLFVDEAHSIGAIGPNGKGVVDYYNCNPKDVDILMGTFSKSFGAAGGYIAGTKRLMEYIKSNSYSVFYGNCMAPPVASQCLAVLNQLIDRSPESLGSIKIKALKKNTRHFRDELMKRGFFIVGHPDSPVVPLILGLYGLTHAFTQFMTSNNIGAIAVGFPATSLVGARSRFCVSAGHTREMLDYIISKVDEFGETYKIKYFKLENK